MTQLTQQQQLTHLRRQIAQVEREITELIGKRTALIEEYRWQHQMMVDDQAGGWLAVQGEAAVEAAERIVREG